MKHGIEKHSIASKVVQIHTAEKAIVDAFYYRRKLGKDVFLEALKDYFKNKKRNIPKLMEAAKVRRVMKTIRPYFEALA